MSPKGSKIINTILLSISIALFPLHIAAQDFTASVRIGGGTYAMSGLKDVQKAIRQDLMKHHITAKSVQSFPPFINFQAQFAKVFYEKYEIGLLMTYESTGGRIHYSDYSGSLVSDQVVSGSGFGVVIERIFQRKSGWEWRQYLQVTLLESTLKLSEQKTIGDQESGHLSKFVSNGIGIEPGASIMRRLTGQLSLKISLGFYFNVSEEFHLKSNNDAVLVDGNNHEVRPEWMGVRAGIGLSFLFH